MKIGLVARGFVTITDKLTNEVLVEKSNSINYETMSEAIANSFADRVNGKIYQMAFGNGGTTVSGTGAITYFPPNVTGSSAQLYNHTYSKVVDDNSPNDTDPVNNNISVSHTQGQNFSDILITCTLGYNEPTGQFAFDNASTFESDFIFDELGIVSFDPVPGAGKLLTHVIFHPVQKALNRIIQVNYTIRIAMSS